MTKRIEVKVPDIGDFSDVDVIEVQVSAGDSVAAEDALITLETEKAAMDVPAPAAGRVEKVLLKVGDKASEGDLILELSVEGADKATDTEAAPAAEAPAGSGEDRPAPSGPGGRHLQAGEGTTADDP